MSNKYILFAILVIILALAISA